MFKGTYSNARTRARAPLCPLAWPAHSSLLWGHAFGTAGCEAPWHYGYPRKVSPSSVGTMSWPVWTLSDDDQMCTYRPRDRCPGTDGDRRVTSGGVRRLREPGTAVELSLAYSASNPLVVHWWTRVSEPLSTKTKVITTVIILHIFRDGEINSITIVQNRLTRLS